jgi:MFS family permease
MISLFICALPISNMLGSLISGLIMQTLDGVAGYAGWQWLFVIEGLPAVALGMPCVLPAARPDCRRQLAEPRRKARHAGRDGSRQPGQTGASSVRDGLLNPKIWLLGAVYFCLVLGQYVISFWMPTIIRNSGVANRG